MSSDATPATEETKSDPVTIGLPSLPPLPNTLPENETTGEAQSNEVVAKNENTAVLDEKATESQATESQATEHQAKIEHDAEEVQVDNKEETEKPVEEPAVDDAEPISITGTDQEGCEENLEDTPLKQEASAASDQGSNSQNDDDVKDEEAEPPTKKRKVWPGRGKYPGRPGRPRGSKSQYADRKPSVENPGQNYAVVPSSSRYLRRIREQNPDLADAYAKLDTAHQEHDAVEKYLAEMQDEVDKLEAKLEKAKERLEQGKIRLEKEKQDVKVAADAVAEAELKSPSRWNTNYQKLVAYKEKHGHVKLPARCPEDKEIDSLCVWVSLQKSKYQSYVYGDVTTRKPHRITALEKLGMVWSEKGVLWKKHYEELLAFKEKHGHCMVPTRTSKEYKDLGSWVGVQRTEYKHMKDGKQTQLTPDRIELLEKIGFVWNVTDLKWQEMYDKLVAFRAQEGHCNVPERYTPDQPLANWVFRQRKEYQLLCDPNDQRSEFDKIGRRRRMQMTQERLKLMNDIGFEW